MTTLDLLPILHAPLPEPIHVCPMCLNRGHILVNAGTGLTKKCPAKCEPPTNQTHKKP
jgi:hypothetical protein